MSNPAAPLSTLGATAGDMDVQLRRIVVPMDFEAGSIKAFRYAVKLAALHGSGITLLHVIDPIGSVPSPTLAEAVNQARARLAAIKEEGSAAGGRVEIAVRTGVVSDEIVDAARELPADLVILATHGQHGLPDFYLSSHTQRVLRYAPCPVLLVRERQRDFVMA